MPGIGSHIKRERELRGTSLEDIAEVTRVNIKVLRALEADDFSSLPSPVFVKGFIRAYSNYIGIDANDAILKYEDYLERQKEPDKTIRNLEKKGKLPISSLLLIIIGLSLFSISAYLFISSYSNSNKPLLIKHKQKDNTEKAISSFPSESETIMSHSNTKDNKNNPPLPPFSKGGMRGFSEEKPPEDPSPTVVSLEEENPVKNPASPPKNHTLIFKASQATWIKVLIDGKNTKEVILQPGEEIKWEAEKGFFVEIGNAGGIKVIFNGKSLEIPGEQGRIVKLSLP